MLIRLYTEICSVHTFKKNCVQQPIESKTRRKSTTTSRQRQAITPAMNEDEKHTHNITMQCEEDQRIWLQRTRSRRAFFAQQLNVQLNAHTHTHKIYVIFALLRFTAGVVSFIFEAVAVY